MHKLGDIIYMKEISEDTPDSLKDMVLWETETEMVTIGFECSSITEEEAHFIKGLLIADEKLSKYLKEEHFGGLSDYFALVEDSKYAEYLNYEAVYESLVLYTKDIDDNYIALNGSTFRIVK